MISYDGKEFTVDEPTSPGMPPVGRGPTIDSALGDWLRNYADSLGIHLHVDLSAMWAELERREAALRKR